jgi:hypothetical protein
LGLAIGEPDVRTFDLREIFVSYNFSLLKYLLLIMILYYLAHAVEYWLRHYATSRKVAGSIPDEVIL